MGDENKKPVGYEEAIKDAKRGLAVRRKKWSKGTELSYDTESLSFRMSGRKGMSIEDGYADDWMAMPMNSTLFLCRETDEGLEFTKEGIPHHSGFGWDEWIFEGRIRPGAYQLNFVDKEQKEKALPGIKGLGCGYTLEGKAETFLRISNSLHIYNELEKRSFNYASLSHDKKEASAILVETPCLLRLYVRFYNDLSWCVIYAE